MDSKTMAIIFGLIAIIGISVDCYNLHKREAKEIPSGDNDDDPDEVFELPDGEPRDCIDRKESETCQDDCREHHECRRTANQMECEDECNGMCKFLQIRLTDKCVTNLVGLVAVDRNGEPPSFRHGSGHKSDRDDDDDDDDDREKDHKEYEKEKVPEDTKKAKNAARPGAAKAPKKDGSGGGSKSSSKGPFGFKFPDMSPGNIMG